MGYIVQIVGEMIVERSTKGLHKGRYVLKSLAGLIAAACFLLILFVSPALADETPSGIPFSELEQRIDELVDKHLGESTPGAAVAIVKDGEIIFSKGYGYADTEAGTPIDPATTVFEYGSISKVFVWVSVMQLVEQGLIDLDNDVTTYLPDDFVFEKPFTMRDLMNHAAGFTDLSFDALTTDWDSNETLKDALLRTQPKQIYEPATVGAYSNWGTTLAAYIVEYLTGQDFCLYEAENIIGPAGMRNTFNQPDWAGNQDFLQSKASGYTPDGRGGFTRGIWSYMPLWPAGAINGTAEDLARFAIALSPEAGASNPFFQNPHTLDKMFSPSTLDSMQLRGTYHGFQSPSGFGGDLLVVGHGGNLATFSTYFSVVPEERLGIAVLANAAGERDILFGIHDLILGSCTQHLPFGTGDFSDAASVEGTYVSARRAEGSFLEFLTYIQPFQITAIGADTIEMQWLLFSATYKQVGPYDFRLETTSYPFMSFIYPSLHFQAEDGQVVHVSGSNGFDLTSVPSNRTAPILAASLVTFLASVLFFMISPIVLLIGFVRMRRREESLTRFDIISNALVFSGTLIMLNNIALLVRALAINAFRATSEVAIHFWLNYLLFALVAGLAVYSATIFKEAKPRTRRTVFHVATVALLVLLFFVFVSWNFFAI